MEENIAAASIYFSVSVFFLYLYVFVFYYIFTHSKERQQTFYKLLIQLSVSDVFMLSLNAFYAAPCTLLGTQIYGDTAGFYLANIDTVGFYVGELTTMLISLHRLSVVAPFQQLLNKLFAGVGLYISMGFCWLGGILWVVASKTLNCPKLFNEKYFYFGYFCQNGTDPVVNARLNDWMLWLPIILAVIMAIMYAVAFRMLMSVSNQISHEATKARRKGSERRLLYQSFIIWLVLTYEIVSFCIFPKYMPNFAGTIITSLGVIVNAGINPVLCLIFHADIRESAVYLLRCCQTKIQSSSGPTSTVSLKKSAAKVPTNPNQPNEVIVADIQ